MEKRMTMKKTDVIKSGNLIEGEEIMSLTTSQKIEALISWGTKPYRISKITEVPENTVRRIWNRETAVSTIKLENAEKIAWYYDMVERNLSEAIATVDLLIYKLDPNRQRLSGNYNLYQKIKSEPYKVFEHLHKSAMDPTYSDKLQQYGYYLDEIAKLIATIDIDIAYNIQLSDLYTYYMSRQRNKYTQG